MRASRNSFINKVANRYVQNEVMCLVLKQLTDQGETLAWNTRQVKFTFNKCKYHLTPSTCLFSRTPNFVVGGGPSSLPNSGVFKSSQSMLEDELMLFRLIDLQHQQTPTSASTGNAPMPPSPSASNFTAVFREPLNATSILNFGSVQYSLESDKKLH